MKQWCALYVFLYSYSFEGAFEVANCMHIYHSWIGLISNRNLGIVCVCCGVCGVCVCHTQTPHTPLCACVKGREFKKMGAVYMCIDKKSVQQHSPSISVS